MDNMKMAVSKGNLSGSVQVNGYIWKRLTLTNHGIVKLKRLARGGITMEQYLSEDRY